jgi:ABC-type cobalamin transport system ATPase subunit
MKRVLCGGLVAGFSIIMMSALAMAEQRTITMNVVACKTKDKTFQVNRWLSQGDLDAVTTEVMNKNCQMLYKGTRVYSDSCGYEWCRVRVKGNNVEVWTLKKFLN